jgi:hypothetical protein
LSHNKKLNIEKKKEKKVKQEGVARLGQMGVAEPPPKFFLIFNFLLWVTCYNMIVVDVAFDSFHKKFGKKLGTGAYFCLDRVFFQTTLDEVSSSPIYKNAIVYFAC